MKENNSRLSIILSFNYMDVFPVTNEQYQEFINERKDYNVPNIKEGWAKSYNWDIKKRTYPEDKAKHPVMLVSYNDTVAFCRWRSEKERLNGDKAYHLPDEREWEKVARGNDDWIYPWGRDLIKFD